MLSVKKCILTLCLISLNIYVQAQNESRGKIDSLFSLIKKENIITGKSRTEVQDTTLVNQLSSLAREYKNIGQYDSALLFTNQALALATDLNVPSPLSIGGTGNGWAKGLALSYNQYGNIFWLQSNYPEALKYYLKSLKISEELKEKKLIGQNISNIGIVYSDQNDFPKALEYYFKALKIEEEVGNKNGIAKNLVNIGLVYDKLTDFVSSPDSISIVYGQALQCYFKALNIFEELGNNNGIATALGNIGIIYHRQKDYSKALEYYLKALKIKEESGHKNGIAVTLGHLGVLYGEQKNYAKAEKFLLKALAISESIGALYFQREHHQLLSDIYTATGDYKKALDHYKKFSAIKDTIFNEEKTGELTRTAMNFEFAKKEAATKAEQEKKEQQIRLLNKDKLIQKKEISLQTLFRNTAIIISFLLFITGFLFYNRARNNKKYAHLLEEKNKLIQLEKEKAVKSEYYKTQFLATMSHEIRTPLHAIAGMINILNQRSPREDQSAYLNVMRKSSDNLIGIINNVLDVSKIESGKIEFEKIIFSPSETLESVVNLLHANAIDNGLFIKTNKTNLPEMVEGDQGRLAQIMINLLGNAIKFTKEGGVTITGSTLAGQTGSEEKCFLQFSIEDTGIGISEDKLEKIFESFSQADEGITRKYGGTGLGLTISKQLVELQGGHIQVKSKPGKGTVFTFVIPYGKVNSSHSAESIDMPLQTESLNGSSILIVEDNYYNRVVAKESLNLLIKDLVVEEAENGLIALEKIAKHDFDFIFMDLQMPEMDGYTTMKKLKENGSFHIRKPVIIALSANSSTDEKDRCLAAGMDNYLSKPFNPNDLLKVMQETKDKIISAQG